MILNLNINKRHRPTALHSLSFTYSSELAPGLPAAATLDPEREPLLQQQASRLGAPIPSTAPDNPPRHWSGDLQSYQASGSSSRSESFLRPLATSSCHHSSDEGFFFYSTIMEKVKNSKIAHWSNKLAVESEPNLTTAQLMLFNHDLKPVRILSAQLGTIS